MKPAQESADFDRKGAHWLRVTSLSVVLLTLEMLGIGCGGNDKGTNPGDTIPPSAVTNLAAGSPTTYGITLSWTAPGDDAGDSRHTVVMATEYDVRYSTGTITEDNWGSATQAAGEPTPWAPGGSQTFTVLGLECNTTFYFALKARDDEPDQWSALSNVPNGRTLACPRELEMVLIPAGTFTMGSPVDEPGFLPDQTQHVVTLTKSFYLSSTEVTQADWQTAMGWNESKFTGDLNRPVERVSWFDAIAFCNKISKAAGLDTAYVIQGAVTTINPISLAEHISYAEVTWNLSANGYRLPTEAEWEYACRAGTGTAFANGGVTTASTCSPVDPNLDRIGWYCGNGGSTTHPVGQKQGNAWGLKDMHGNVWEWCWDWYAGGDGGDATDPKGPDSGMSRVQRGGCFQCGPVTCRSALRIGFFPGGNFSEDFGLRVAKVCLPRSCGRFAYAA